MGGLTRQGGHARGQRVRDRGSEGDLGAAVEVLSMKPDAIRDATAGAIYWTAARRSKAARLARVTAEDLCNAGPFILMSLNLYFTDV